MAGEERQKERWHRLKVELNTPLNSAVDEVSGKLGVGRAELVREALSVYFQILRLALLSQQIPTISTESQTLPLNDFAPRLAETVFREIDPEIFKGL